MGGPRADYRFDNCIKKELSCSGGDLGNGKQMTMLAAYNFSNISTKTTLADPPPRPN